MTTKRTIAFSLFSILIASLCLMTPQLGAQEKAKDSQEQSKQETEASAEKKAKRNATERFLRIRKDAKGRAVALETSITRYEMIDDDNNRITVDLIGAVHIGEAEYFQALNERFEQYESMLYELVAPEGTVIPKGGGPREAIPTNPIAGLQKTMQTQLELEFQLEHIDYTKKNFTHADMTPTEFAESMKENDESIGGYAIRAIGQSMAMQSAGKGSGGMDMVFALFSKNKALRLRRSFAQQIQDMESAMVIFNGRDGSTIIDHRNAKCLRVMQDEIDKGKRNLAIFYGAGHLAAMDKTLMEEFKMKRGGQIWLKAWSLTNRNKSPKKK